MHKLAEICVRRPLFAVMLNLALVVLGVIGYLGLGVDLFPKVDIPSVIITTLNPGAGPEEIESGLTSKIESAVNTISGVTSIQSQSYEGLSTISVAFDINVNGDLATQQVRDKIGTISDLPRGATIPRVDKLDFEAAPVLRITLSSPRSLPSLTQVADEMVKRQLERVTGVGQVRILGGTERQVRISVDPDRLQALGLSIPEVSQGIQRQNLDMPGGRLSEGDQEVTVRTLGAIRQPDQMNDLIIAQRGSRPIRLSEIATVTDTTAELRSASRLNGSPAVSLLVMKQSGENAIEVIDQVKARLAGITASLPSDVRLEVIGDESIFIRAAIEQIKEHLILGSVFAAIVVFLFLRDWRATIIAAIAIPVSLTATFALIKVAGYTLNQVTMLALTLMVGVVIDDAIVVLENIYHVMNKRGLDPFKAAVEGTREIGLPVLATTLSLLAVFVPVGFMHGLVGRFLSSFGLTSAFAIAISLFVSFTLTPMMSARMLRPGAVRMAGGDKGIYSRLEASYVRLLKWSLDHRKAVIATSLLLTLSVWPMGMMVGKDFRPVEDQSRFEVTMTAPEGSTLAQTLLYAERVAVSLRGLEGVTETLTTVGGNDGEPVNQASVYVNMLPMNQRRVGQVEVMARARETVKSYPSAWNITVQAAATAAGGGGQTSDVEYVLTGPDLATLNRYATELAKRLTGVKEATDIGTSVARPKPEIRVEIRRDSAADLGVATADVAQSLNSLVAGQQVAMLSLGDKQVPVWLQVQERYRASTQGLQLLSVTSSRGGWVSLESVATLTQGTGPAQIERLNRQRQVRVFANVRAGSSQSAVNAAFAKELEELNLPAGYQFEEGGTSKQLASAGSDFGFAFLLSFIFMYMVLVAQMESLIQPVIILLTLPLAVPCGILGLLLMGQNMNIFSGLGILLLFGVVKKNAILQITHTNQLRSEGLPREEALIESNKDRLRPILMTTLALVAGMMPLVFANGPGSSTSRSIGVLVAAGQTLCLVLTLLMVPVFYTLFEDLSNAQVFKRFRSSGSPLPKLAPLVLVVLGAATATAQPNAVQHDALPGRFPEAAGQVRRIELSLQQVLELALANNQDLAVARLEVQNAERGADGAAGAYDPRVGVVAYRERRTIPVSSALAGSATGQLPESETLVRPELAGLLPWFGGTYSTSLNNRRLNSQNIFDPLAPQYQTALNFTYTQPLLRNRSIDAPRNQLRVAQRRIQLTTSQFHQWLSDVVLQVVSAYWDLYAVRQGLEARRSAWDAAKRMADTNRRRYREGLGSEAELIESEANVQRLREGALASLDRLNQVENAIKFLVLQNAVSLEWNAEIIPTSIPTLTKPLPDLALAMKQALKSRPEIEVLQDLQEINEITRRFTGNQRLPALDFSASYTPSGLAGIVAVRPPNPLFPSGGSVPPVLIGGYGSSLANLFGGDFPILRFSLSLSFPIRNRTAEANNASALIEQRRLDRQLEKQQKVVEQETRNAEFSLRIAEDRQNSARQSTVLAEKLLASEERRFDAGLSSVFLVSQRRDSLMDARLTEAEVQSTLSKIEAAYRRAVGTLLDSLNIRVADEVRR